jgi:hypothetical protein
MSTKRQISAGCPRWVIRDRGRVSIKSGYVRSTPKATELLRRHETTRWATSGLMHRSKLRLIRLVHLSILSSLPEREQERPDSLQRSSSAHGRNG